MQDDDSHSTVRDGLEFFRRRRVVIVSLMIVGLAVATALSLTQTKVYSAEASLRVREPSQDLSIAGLPAGQGDLPAQTAAQAAQTVSRASVLQQVHQQLRWTKSVGDVRSHLSVSQDAQSNLVHITATAGTADRAAALANATAGAAAQITNRETAARYAKLARKLRQQANAIARKLPKNFAKLSAARQSAYQTNLRQQQVLGEQAARLTALSAVTQVAQVAETATPPSSPSSPTPVRDGLLGLLAGLVLGILAGLLLDSLDRRLRSSEDLDKVLGLPVAGGLPKGWLGTDAGAEASPKERDARMASFRMLRNNLRFLAAEDPPRVVLVTSPVPEEGKTTTALGLARAAAASRMRTLLIEADLHRPVHAKRLGVDDHPGLAEAIRNGLPLDQVVQTVRFADIALRGGAEGELPEIALDCVVAGDARAISAEMLGSEEFAAFVAHARSVYDLVVIDSAPLLVVAETLQMAALADAILYCVRIGQTTTEQAKAGRDSLQRLPPRFIGLVLTDISRGDSSYGYPYKYDYYGKGGGEASSNGTASPVAGAKSR